METKLKEILTLIVEWIKFAEAKNAGLLVLNSGSIIGTLSIYKDLYELPNCSGLKIAIILFVILNFRSLYYVFESISAKYSNNYEEIASIKNESLTPNNSNLIFFGHLAFLSEEQLISEMQNQYGLQASENQKIEKDLANQIIINSHIALQKFILFNEAIIATRNAFLISIIIAIISEFIQYISILK